MKITKNSGYYLPLFNKYGLKASITPYFGGSLSLGHHNYLLTPVSDLSLYDHTYGRNVIFTVDGEQYFLNGNTKIQQDDILTYQFGKLYQKVIRENSKLKLETTSFIAESDNTEVHLTKITNTSQLPFKLNVITNTLLYARSADNIRDHRHVTSLLNRVSLDEQGILVKPTLSFDERGHLENEYIYSIFASLNNLKPNRYITSIDDFLAGGSFNYPKGTNNLDAKVKDGYEVMGAIGFEDIILKPNEEATLIFTLGIAKNLKETKNFKKYLEIKNVEKSFEAVKQSFDEMIAPLEFMMVDSQTTELLKWVSLQPILRRYYGNSYLPHHDYGHGGRGWRDLWQDLLSLIMYNDQSVKNLLYNNFAGIRVDGSNATIIGDKPGEFKADRNQIIRVWSDHGAWPLLTTKMYLDETNDLQFLMRKQSYFADGFTHYTYKKNAKAYTSNLQTNHNSIYEGTILEHLLLQNIVGFLNTGQFGFTKLEDADWNDGLDMAKEFGETIAFTMFYTNNLKELAKLIEDYQIKEIVVFNSLKQLLFAEITLKHFFDKVANFSEEVVIIEGQDLVKQLLSLYDNKVKYINEKAWNKHFYQSYYDNSEKLLDSDLTTSLTGQTMALLNNIASLEQAKALSLDTKEKLFVKNIGGYRLNSNYQSLKMDLGRAYGFAYGHKENGAVFNHMAMMYSYGLYKYNLNDLAREAYMSVIEKSLDSSSNLLAGIPEYFSNEGVGMYPYLTGSATWLLKLLREQVFGINLNLGKLTFNPKLTSTDFIDGKAFIKTYLFGSEVIINYYNSKDLDVGKYQISEIKINGISTNERVFDKIKGTISIYLDEKSDSNV